MNPVFVDAGAWDFALQDVSPCIDAGDPTVHDPDGTVSDMGALFYDQRTAVDDSGTGASDRRSTWGGMRLLWLPRSR